jgi:hypothetical protein
LGITNDVDSGGSVVAGVVEAGALLAIGGALVTGAGVVDAATGVDVVSVVDGEVDALPEEDPQAATTNALSPATSR